MLPNFIGKFVQKAAFLLHIHGFRSRYHVLTHLFFSTVTVTALLHHSIDIIDLETQRVGYQNFQLREVMLELWRNNMLHQCIPQLSWSGEW